MSKPLAQNAHTRSKTTLCVFPNVYAAVDHLGRLSAAVRFDPEHGRAGSVHFVGATITRTPIDGFIRNEQRERGVRQTMYDTTVEHVLREEKVPHTDFFVRQLRDGALIPGNEETARIAKIRFVDPAIALAQKREDAIAELRTIHPQSMVEEIVGGWPVFEIGGVVIGVVDAREDAVDAPTAPAIAHIDGPKSKIDEVLALPPKPMEGVEGE